METKPVTRSIDALSARTRFGQLMEQAESKNLRFLVHAGDAVSLTNALDNALKKNWDRVCISRYGSQNTWSKVADRVVEVFKSV